jgi:UDP-N-acetylglucosamine 1-carboxyvinyltransferase
MEKMLIEGGRRLKGEATVGGSKNATLPVMVAALLAEGRSKIEGVPRLRDVDTMSAVLRHLGAKANQEGSTLEVDATGLASWEAPYDLVRTMRASIYVMGALLARLGRARVSLPGGCAIGQRPIDYHLKGFEALGAKITLKHGYVEAVAKKLKGARIVFDKPSVGATCNVMMAASLASGTTYLHNPAEEPEVVDLAGFLNRMGAKVEGAGSDCITIKGVSSLKPCEYRIIPDRIEAATLVAAAAITGGSVTLRQARLSDLGIVSEKFKEHGVALSEGAEGRDTIKVSPGRNRKPVHICTMPHPGFPTDMQAQWMSLMSVTKGTSVITETIWENRFMHISEMERMGADIRVQGNSAVVTGVPGLSAAPVMASDLRASAALVLSGLAAKGTTEVSRIYHLDRGYESLEKKLEQLGARVRRVPE